MAYLQSDDFANVGGFESPEVTSEGELLFGVNDALLLTHGEVLAKTLDSTQAPGNRQQRSILDVDHPRVFPVE